MKQQNIFTFDKDLCFIDIETTGPVIGFHEIIDIAFIRTHRTRRDVCPNARSE
ncbi:MAG: hypothetical protein U1G07_06400 [Verrucomicrobiota bacterium]